MENTPEIKQFIRENSSLFWYFKQDEKENINHEILVEFILNYGDEISVKKLFELLGIDYVADIFYEQTNRQRVNYQKRTIHYFNLYFKKYAHRNIV
ncbi:MAG: hypothetical protein JXR68_08700 [Bacteroidales bacterium]|nr:hypothetical protein [Bacteroidales bacterium]